MILMEWANHLMRDTAPPVETRGSPPRCISHSLQTLARAGTVSTVAALWNTPPSPVPEYNHPHFKGILLFRKEYSSTHAIQFYDTDVHDRWSQDSSTQLWVWSWTLATPLWALKKRVQMRPPVRTVSKAPCSAKTREELCAWYSVSPLGCYHLRNSFLVVGKTLHISSSSSHGHKMLNGCLPLRSLHGSQRELQGSWRVPTTKSNFLNMANVLFPSSGSCHYLTEEVSRERVTHSRGRWHS